MFTYYYDRKKAMGKLQEDGVEVTPEEQEHRRNHLHIQQQKRLEEGSLDPQNIQDAKQKKEAWIKKDEELLENNHDLNDNKKLDFMDFLYQDYRKKNSKETIDYYMSKLNINTDNKEVIRIVEESLMFMPEKDLNILDEFSLSLESTDGYNRYRKVGKLRRLMGEKRTIFINPQKSIDGSFAHEFAHFAADVKKIYEDPDFLEILEDVLGNATGLKSKKILDKEYVYLVSDRFIKEYQGRTYVQTGDFKGKLEPSDLKEYISIGYQIYISNPSLLENKDKKLYDYFVKRGLSNGK